MVGVYEQGQGCWRECQYGFKRRHYCVFWQAASTNEPCTRPCHQYFFLRLRDFEEDVMARAPGCAVAAVACALLAGTAQAHLSAVCSATTAKRPGTATFLLASYHVPPLAGASVPGVLSIKSPQGTIYEFAFNNFCGPDQWDLSESVSYYRESLLPACVCSSILGCGAYNAVTGKCTSTAGDCPTIAPKDVHIDCFGQEESNPSWVGQSWARIKGDDEKGNCAFGSSAADGKQGGSNSNTFVRTYVAAGRPRARMAARMQLHASVNRRAAGWFDGERRGRPVGRAVGVRQYRLGMRGGICLTRGLRCTQLFRFAFAAAQSACIARRSAKVHALIHTRTHARMRQVLQCHGHKPVFRHFRALEYGHGRKS